MIRTGKEKKAGGREGETMMSAEINRRKEAVNEGKERRGKTKEGERAAQRLIMKLGAGDICHLPARLTGRIGTSVIFLRPQVCGWNGTTQIHFLTLQFSPKRLIISVDTQSFSVTQEIHRGEKLI